MNTNHHVKMIEYTEKYDFWAEQDSETLSTISGLI